MSQVPTSNILVVFKSINVDKLISTAATNKEIITASRNEGGILFENNINNFISFTHEVNYSETGVGSTGQKITLEIIDVNNLFENQVAAMTLKGLLTRHQNVLGEYARVQSLIPPKIII